MYVHVRTDIGIDFYGVKTVVAKVVISERKVNFTGNDAVSLLGMKTDIEVCVFEDVDGPVGLNLTEMDVTNADTDAALVFPAQGFVIRSRVVIQRLAAVGLVGASRGVRVGEPYSIGSGDPR